MFRFALVPTAALVLVSCAAPTTLAPATATRVDSTSAVATRAGLVAELAASRDAFLLEVSGLTEAQIRFKAAPDQWSIAEVAEHIVVTEERLLATVTDKVLQTEMTPALRAQLMADDGRILRSFADRTKKRQAPEVLQPSGRFPTMEALISAFGERRAATMGFAQNTAEDLRGHAMQQPALGVLDAHQWLLLISAHCRRHTAQIVELKAASAYPR